MVGQEGCRVEKVIFDSLGMGRLWCSMNQEKVNGSREPSEEALVRSQTRTSLVVQELQIHLPVQGTEV